MAVNYSLKQMLANGMSRNWILAVIILVFIAASVISFPHSIQLYGKLVPMQRWVLMRTEDGQVTYMTVNYLTGMQESFYANQMERGEIVKFHLLPGLAGRERVVYQDTLAVMTSSEANERLAQLQGERDMAIANLIAARSGEKQSVVDTYRHRLEQARSIAEEKSNMADRAVKLYEKKLLSLAEYEVAVNEARVAHSEVESAMAQLTDIRTGVKPEQVQLLETQIESLNRQIELAAQRIKSYTILAPFSGTLETMVNTDTLLILSDDSQYALLMPVRTADCAELRLGMTVSYSITGQGEPPPAVICKIGREIQYLNGESVRLVTAKVDKSAWNVSPGTILPCRLGTGRTAAIKRLLQGWR